jgi:hypothetical protein
MKWLTVLIVSWSSIAVADGPLAREQVIGAMSALRPQLGACYAQYRVAGVAVVDLTIAPAGTVAAAELQPPGRGISSIAPASPTGVCVKQAVLAARFPRFTGAPQTLAYPLVIDDRATVETPPAPPASTALDRAQKAYVAGQYADAIKLATDGKADDPPRAWRIIGAASCFAGDAAGATAALDALDDKGRRFVAYVCANNKVALPAR